MPTQNRLDNLLPILPLVIFYPTTDINLFLQFKIRSLSIRLLYYAILFENNRTICIAYLFISEYHNVNISPVLHVIFIYTLTFALRFKAISVWNTHMWIVHRNPYRFNNRSTYIDLIFKYTKNGHHRCHTKTSLLTHYKPSKPWRKCVKSTAMI